MAGRPARSAVVEGALWMLAQAAAFSAMVATVRWLSPSFSPYEIVLFRCLVACALQLPWFLREGRRELTTDRRGTVCARGVFGFAGMAAWFAALGLVPLTDAVALQFTQPLFIIVGAALILGEGVGARRAVATLIGFAGALVIIRPGFEAVSPAILLVLVSVAFYAGTHLMTKSLAGRFSGAMLSFQFHAIALPLALVPSLADWSGPRWEHVPWILALGGFGTLAHMFLGRAYRLADASIVIPIDFSKLVMAAILGYVLFAETSDVWTWVGAVVIFAATTYVTRHESRRARAAASARGA